jgi:hypothetical protein
MDWDRGQVLLARMIAVASVGVALGGCDLLTNSDFMQSLRRDGPSTQEASGITEQGLGKLAKGELMGASTLFDQALKANPSDVYALAGKGIINQRMGNPVAARAAFEQVMALKPPETLRMSSAPGEPPIPIRDIAAQNLGLIASADTSGSPALPATMPAVMPPAAQQPGPPSMASMPPSTTPVLPGMAMATPATMGASARPQPVPKLVPGLLSEADFNTLIRFDTLQQLRDRGLITPDEYNERRTANLAALLPMTTRTPSSAGLDRPAPPADQIINRLDALSRALEMRAINQRQHSAERLTIIDGLMPSQPKVMANPAPTPKDFLAAADVVRKLEVEKERALISSEEYDKEKAALDQATAPPPPKPVVAQPVAPVTTTPEAAGAGPKPAVHLASYRSADAANKGWTQVKRANASLLGNLQSEVSRVNLGAGKGVFFRLMAGPFKTQADAERVCRELKAKKQFCETAFMTGAGSGPAAPADESSGG